MKNTKRPNCYDCEYRGELIGNAHSECFNLKAKVKGNEHGIKSGWFCHPSNFDPTWLEECDGFKKK